MSFVAKWEDLPAIGDCAQCRASLIDVLSRAIPGRGISGDGQGISTSSPISADEDATLRDILARQADAKRHYHWQVSGMDCGSCAAKVRGAVERLPGVADVDVALMADDLARLPFAVDLSRQTRSIIRQNMIVSLGIVVVLIPATIFGLGIGPAVAVHEGSTLIVVANALRLLAYKEKSGAKAIMETQA